MDPAAGYDEALAQASRIYPGVRVGRPGRARTYWPTTAVLRLLRLRVKVDLDGAQHVADGPAILVANHLSGLDPVVAAMSTWWRITAFTKAEWFEGATAPFFRLMGQIPLRRGDEASTDWALDMARRTLADGSMVGIYPEGTRGPEPATLYRLHQRVLYPLIAGSPQVPVHVIATTYTDRGRRHRTIARVRISPALPVDPRTMTPDQITRVIRDALIEHGDLAYVDQYAFVVKARAKRAAEAAAAAEARTRADDAGP